MDKVQPPLEPRPPAPGDGEELETAKAQEAAGRDGVMAGRRSFCSSTSQASIFWRFLKYKEPCSLEFFWEVVFVGRWLFCWALFVFLDAIFFG